MVTEKSAVVEIKIVVPLFAPLERVVKRRVEVVILPAGAHNVPCVAVFDPARGIYLAERDNAPQAKLVAQGLDRLCNALAHTDALCHGAKNLVGIRLLKLVIAHVFQNKIVYGKFLFQFRLACKGPRQPGQPRAYRLLLRTDFGFVK